MLPLNARVDFLGQRSGFRVVGYRILDQRLRERDQLRVAAFGLKMPCINDALAGN